MLTSAQFDRTRQLALRLAGIELFERHRELLSHRIQRLGIRDGARLDGMLDAVESGDPAATRQLVGLLTTNFTGFFRHPRHFEIAAAHAIGAVRRNGRARLWSAAASSGEEPYSLAIAVIEAFGSDDPPVGILATDIDADALAAAERGEFREQALRELDPSRRERFFRKAESGAWCVAPAARRLVEFLPLNLAAGKWPVAGPFDAVFCRNVLMYLEKGRRAAVLKRLVSLLAPDGLLIMDPTESPGVSREELDEEGAGVYARAASHALNL